MEKGLKQINEGANEFDRIFQEAVKLREAKDKLDKKVFDSLPDVVQQTIFYPKEKKSNEVENKSHQLLIWEKQMKAALACLGEKKYEECLTFAKLALGSVWYLELKPGAPHWRDRGIKDEWNVLVKLDDDKIRDCILLIAESLLAVKDYRQCIAYCNYILSKDSMFFGVKSSVVNEVIGNSKQNFCLKALAIRGDAYMFRKLGNDEEMAFEDFRTLYELNPTDASNKAKYEALSAIRKKQAMNEKMFFKNAFDKLSNSNEFTKEQQEAARVERLNQLKNLKNKNTPDPQLAEALGKVQLKMMENPKLFSRLEKLMQLDEESLGNGANQNNNGCCKKFARENTYFFFLLFVLLTMIFMILGLRNLTLQMNYANYREKKIMESQQQQRNVDAAL